MIISIPGYTINSECLYSGLSRVLFSATRDKDKANVVIKTTKNENPSLEDIAELKHEFEIAKICESEEGIVNVYSLEKYNDSYAIIMENIITPTLSEVIAIEKKLKLADFLELAIHLSESLEHLHRHNIIHNNINPTNIMCDISKKKVKIIDFGLSTTLPQEHFTSVSPNLLKEINLHYISPEQTGLMNRWIDYRTDYYSLGVLLYQLLTGQLPFSSNEPMELLYWHVAAVPKNSARDRSIYSRSAICNYYDITG